ncbi:hypothetical protein V5E38_22360 [Rossellomorea sp. GAMAL-10_SWC]
MLNNKSSSKKQMQSKENTYIFIDNLQYRLLYIKLDQNIVSLIYYMLLRGKPFNFFTRKTRSRVLNFIKPLVCLIRVIEFIYLIYKKKYLLPGSQSSHPNISTIHNGHCLLVTVQGEYKIVNFKEKILITFFPNHFSIKEIKEIITKFKESQKCKLAPELISWDIKKRFMKESYYNIKTSSFNFKSNQHFYSEVLPILKDIILSNNHQLILLKNHIQNLNIRINKLVELYLKENKKLKSFAKNIQDFIVEINEKLEEKPSEMKLFLVFSHGDFWEGNILKNKLGCRVIDWNTLNKRSYFFDFYFIMFDIISKMDDSVKYNQSRKIEDAYKFFISNNMKNINFKNFVDQSETYQYIYYLEYILLKLQENLKRDVRYLGYLEEQINFFKLYELYRNENLLFSDIPNAFEYGVELT